MTEQEELQNELNELEDRLLAGNRDSSVIERRFRIEKRLDEILMEEMKAEDQLEHGKNFLY